MWYRVAVVVSFVALAVLAAYGGVWAEGSRAPVAQTVPTQQPTSPNATSAPPVPPAPSGDSSAPVENSSEPSSQPSSTAPTAALVQATATITPAETSGIMLSTTRTPTQTAAPSQTRPAPTMTVLPNFSFSQPTAEVLSTIPPLGTPTPSPMASATPSIPVGADALISGSAMSLVIAGFIILAAIIVGLGTLYAFKARKAT
jgi:hypothetical protein